MQDLGKEKFSGVTTAPLPLQLGGGDTNLYMGSRDKEKVELKKPGTETCSGWQNIGGRRLNKVVRVPIRSKKGEFSRALKRAAFVAQWRSYTFSVSPIIRYLKVTRYGILLAQCYLTCRWSP